MNPADNYPELQQAKPDEILMWQNPKTGTVGTAQAWKDGLFVYVSFSPRRVRDRVRATGRLVAYTANDVAVMLRRKRYEFVKVLNK